MRLYFQIFLAVITIGFLFSTKASQESPRIYDEFGNIYYKAIGKKAVQVTSSTKDSSPLLAPNKKLIAFIRTSNKLIPKEFNADTETPYANEIWVYDILSHKEYLLVGNNFSREPAKTLIDPFDLTFSADSKTLYFLTSAWTTSRALHAVTISSKKLRYIIPANSFELVKKGPNKGYFIVFQHRYFVSLGTYDWYWLFNPQGKEIGPIGPDLADENRDFIDNY